MLDTSLHDRGTAPAVSSEAPIHSHSPRVDLYERQVPPFVDAALDSLYGSIYSTVGMFRFDGSIASANTYVARQGNAIIALLLYRVEGNLVTVLNGQIALGRHEIERFARTIFARYPAVSIIQFHTVQANLQDMAYPCQQYFSGEDIVAPLPATPEEYFARLGKNMRETIKRYRNRVKRAFPTFEYRTYIREEADPEQIRALFRLQRARMEVKNEVSRNTDEEIERVIALTHARGLVTIATIDGVICGGMVCWRAGDNYFMRTIAHDPRYDDMKLGTLSCYDTICECIRHGGKAFHFSPGRLLYKYRFLGVEQPYDRIVLYRSRWQMACNARIALKTAIEGRIREGKLWLFEAETRNDRVSRTALKILYAWRAVKKADGLAAKFTAARSVLWLAPEAAGESPQLYSASAQANEEIIARRRAGPSTKTSGAEHHDRQAA